MQLAVLASLAAGILIPILLYVLGADHVRGGFLGRADSGPGSTDEPAICSPVVAMIVPLTGKAPEMEACLESLLSQDYDGYEVLFVTRDAEDPAADVVRKIISGRSGARHVLAGTATRCGQKNHNLLAGVRAVGSSADVLVFCDANHVAPPFLLRDLLRPIAEGQAVLTCGFHRIVAKDFTLPTLGMLLSVMAIHLLQAITLITQPWGGATAIRRTVFDQYEVPRVWMENVVDDLSMGTYLLKFGIRVKPVSSACMTTPLSGQTLTGWSAWLTRQLLFLKFCQPANWVASAFIMYLFAGPILLAAASVLGGGLGLVSPGLAAAGLAYLICFTGLGIWWRSLVPEPIPLAPWIAAFYAANLMGFRCYLRTLFLDILTWRGVAYRVGRGGKVLKVIPDR